MRVATRQFHAVIVMVLIAHGAVFWGCNKQLAPQGAEHAIRSQPLAVRLVRAGQDAFGPQAEKQPANDAGGRVGTKDEAALSKHLTAVPSARPELEFASTKELDHPIVPRSAPDLQALQGVRFSGLPLRLRLFIDAQGSVLSVQVLASEEAEETVEAVRAMFLATAFVPGERSGKAVPAFADIELQLDASS